MTAAARHANNSPAATKGENSMSSYVAPEIQDKFETLSIDLKNLILSRNVRLNTMYDLIHVLEDIVAEGEAE
jgi:hypothetical protein